MHGFAKEQKYMPNGNGVNALESGFLIKIFDCHLINVPWGLKYSWIS